MEYCSQCFREKCRCGKYKVEIDYYIYPAIYELNRKGYLTTSCCSGHECSEYLSTYISFSDEIEVDIDSDYFQYDSYNYRGFHEKRNRICVKPDIIKKYKKKRTNKLDLIQVINRDLYAWAMRLPAKISVVYPRIDFTEDYFDQEVESDEIIDVQLPWILFAKASKGCSYTADDFFNEIERTGELTELIVNRAGRMKRFCESDYILNNGMHTNNSAILTEKIKFDISGDFHILLCGYEPYITTERLLIGEASWYLSYARTDIATTYGDAEEVTYQDYSFKEEDDEEIQHDYPTNKIACRKLQLQHESLFDEDDIVDYFDEHPNNHELDLFAYLFNRMCAMNINICVFSADNVNIIFSNRTDFSLLMTEEQNVIAFGKADYEFMDFSRIYVNKKEALIYANGRLLTRKELE